MVTFNKAMTGNRVYRGAGQSPNTGQVSAQGAQGYIQREMRNKQQVANGRQMGNITPRPVGSDGQSDNRSTVAAQALQRQAGAPGAPGGPDSGSHAPGSGQPGSGIPGHIGSIGSQQPSSPDIQVSENGQLNLPYNQDYAQAYLQATQDANAQQLGLTQQLQGENRNYEQTKFNTLNSNAAHGTAFSSMYGTAVANNAANHANVVGDIQTQQSSIQQALQQQLGLLAEQYANELGSQAGSLGYGQATPNLNTGPVDPHPGGYGHNNHKGPKHRGNVRQGGQSKTGIKNFNNPKAARYLHKLVNR